MTTIFAKPPPGYPDLRRRLRIELAEFAQNSRIVVVPGADDWFGETEVPSITNVEIEARVGDATRAHFDCVMVQAVTETRQQIAGAFTQPRFWRARRLWLRFRARKDQRIALTRGAA